jgi:hypothetical protein
MMDAHLNRLRDGEIDFDEFTRATRADWQALARHLMRRWACPEAVALEDVEQELLVGCWRAVEKFDPTRGVTLSRFCVFNAMSDAKGWIHKQRHAGHDGDKGPSRHATPFSRLSEATMRRILGGARAPDQERALSRREALRRAVEACTSQRDALCVLAFHREGSHDGAARLLFDDRELRRRCGFKSRDDVRRAVRRAVGRAVQRRDAMEAA